MIKSINTLRYENEWINDLKENRCINRWMSWWIKEGMNRWMHG